MNNKFAGKCMFAAPLLALMMPVLAMAQNAENSPYRVTGETGTVHIYPTPELSRQIKAQTGSQALGVLTYQGGPIMTGESLYAIFWVPATLQTGAATSLSAKYETVAKQFLGDYPYHGIANNSTQYYSTPPTKYFTATGGLAGFYIDKDAYPASGCTDSVTPGNCITDAQLQAEIRKVMTLKGWTPSLKKMFLVFTSTGEGSCFDSTSSSCAYTSYCAYHGYFGSTSAPTIYANQPYADPNYCYYTGVQTDPSGDIPSDANVNVASHEITEANTDPELDAWWDTSNGEEIGDLCAWTFGTNTWDSAKANQMWNGRFYELQLEYDNHTSSCVQVGP